MKTAIIIPARYGSTRFPGKPLARLMGRSILQIVYQNALNASSEKENVYVATDDGRIEAHCAQANMRCVMTSSACETGTDRVLEALGYLKETPDNVINLQGDAPFTPPDFIRAIIDGLEQNEEADIVTPVEQLSWDALDKLRIQKTTTPFSGTTAILGARNKALWFSKQIIPAIRKEKELREKNTLSPVCRHIGLYGYKREALQKFGTLAPSRYEELEGLEQLRAIEAGINIHCVVVDYKGRPALSGIDSPEDLERAEQLLERYAET